MDPPVLKVRKVLPVPLELRAPKDYKAIKVPLVLALQDQPVLRVAARVESVPQGRPVLSVGLPGQQAPLGWDRPVPKVHRVF